MKIQTRLPCRRRFGAAVIGAGLLIGSTVQAGEANDARRQVRSAIRALQDGRPADALEGFREAEVMFPESAELMYNQGVAHYRLRDFEKAKEAFSRALRTRNLKLEAKTKFNLGNCAYAEALERLSSLEDAIARLQTAIRYYRDALDVNPNDTDARANIESAQLLIKDLLDKKKNEQQQPPTSQPASQPSEDQQCENPQQDQQQQDQEPQQQGEQQEEQGGQGQEEQKPDPQQEGQQGRQQQQVQQAEGAKRQMSRAEAERLLQAVRDKERKRREARRARLPAGRARVEKDW
jgi:Ca-activated chloride channel family protein